jgi:hypothetical protein
MEAGQVILKGKPASSTHIFVSVPLLTSAIYSLLFFGLYAMNTLYTSGTCWEKSQPAITCGNPSGFFIIEKYGATEPEQELVPKFTNTEFCENKNFEIKRLMNNSLQ